MEKCPHCGGDKVRSHCHDNSPTCTWLKCPECRLTIDPERRRGLDRDNNRVELA